MTSLLRKELIQPAEYPKLSPSSINLFMQDKALWVLKHYYGQTSEFNIYAMRGISVEEGVNAYFGYDPTSPKPERLQMASNVAKEHFVNKAFFWDDTELREKIENMIDPWVETSVKALEDYSGETPNTQIEILTEIEEVPVRGFIDYTYRDCQIDLKTTNTVKKAITRGKRKGFLPADKSANVRQQAVYQKATGLETGLLYTSPDDSYLHILSQEELDIAMDDVLVSINEMKDIINSPLEGVLEKSVPQWDKMNFSFYWDAELRSLARNLWSNYADNDDEGY